MKYFFFILVGIIIVSSCKTLKSFLPKKKTAEWYYQQGVLEAKNTNSYVAINNFTKAIKKKSNYYDAYYERANTYIILDSIDSAVRDYDSLLNMKSLLNQDKIAQLYYLKGNALYLNSADSSACTYWRKAKDLGHNNSWDKVRKYCK